MIRQYIIVLACFYFLFFHVSPALAYRAVVLTDYELDQIHAGGLNLGFDNPLGGLGNIVSESTNGTAVKDVNTPNSISVVVNPKGVAGTAATDNVAQTFGTNDATTPDPSDNVTQNFGTNDATTPDPSDTVAQNFGTNEGTFASRTGNAAQLGSIINEIKDIYKSADGKLEVMAYESAGLIKSDAINELNVTDTAQQYLNSFNNVNAVGSTVLIQQNLIVLINSQVENLNTSNSLDMSNLVPLQ